MESARWSGTLLADFLPGRAGLTLETLHPFAALAHGVGRFENGGHSRAIHCYSL
ncbi:MAG: hypothetical protein AAF975_01080 [Spirochaetota bacterium]